MPSRFWKASGNPLTPASAFFTVSGGGGTQYRAFRIVTTVTAGGTTVGIAEFGPATSVGGANSAVGVATASADTTNSSFVPANAIDNNLGTLWNSINVPATLTLDFGTNSSNWVHPVEFILSSWSSGNGNLMPANFTIDGTTGDPAGSPTWTNLVTQTGITWSASQTQRFASA